MEFLYEENEGLIALGLLILLLAAGEIGFRWGRRERSRAEHPEVPQTTNIQSAILALLGLLLAFSCSMAVARYDLRKQLVVEEANAIGTTYLRAQLFPQPYKAEASALLRQYVDARLEWYEGREDDQRTKQASDHAEQIQDQLWSVAIAVGQQDPRSVTAGLFQQTLNDLIDLSAKRTAALQNRVPEAVMLLLFLAAGIAIAVVGYGYGLADRQDRTMLVALSVTIVVVVVVIIDLDRPRYGLIQISQQSLLDLRDSLNEPKPWDQSWLFELPEQSIAARPDEATCAPATGCSRGDALAVVRRFLPANHHRDPGASGSPSVAAPASRCGLAPSAGDGHCAPAMRARGILPLQGRV